MTAFQMVMFEKETEAYVVEKKRFEGTFLETLELGDFPFDIQVSTLCAIQLPVEIET